MIRALLLVLGGIFSPFAFSNFFVDGMSGNDKQILLDDFSTLKAIDLPKHNRWFYENTGRLSGSGEDLLSWLLERDGAIVGPDYSYSGCNSTESKESPKCTESRRSLSGIRFIPLPDKNFALPLLSEQFKNGYGLLDIQSTGAFPITPSNGRFFQMRGLSKKRGIGREADTWYRLASYLALVRLEESLIKGDIGITTCKDALLNQFFCDQHNDGAYAVLGILLRDFASICDTCKPSGRAFLYYAAADSLLRIPGDRELNRISSKIMLHYKEDMDLIGLDTGHLANLKRWQAYTSARSRPMH